MNFAIRKPLITEKGNINAENNKYTFIVEANSSKSQIRSAFLNMYKDGQNNIEIAGVNTMCYEGKRVLRSHSKGRRIEGKKTGYKKAIITLKKGSSIDIYSVPDAKK